MAVRITGPDQALALRSNLPTSDAFTVTAWINANPINGQSQYGALAIESAVSGNAPFFHYLGWDSTPSYGISSSPGGRTNTFPTRALNNEWFFTHMTARSGVLAGEWWDTEGVGGDGSAQTITIQDTFTPAQLGIGGNSYNFWIDAAYAVVKFWDTDLTDDEIKAEMHTIRPQRFANLIGWWPLFQGDNRLLDFSGQGNDLTEFGTGFTQEDGPPVSWGSQIVVRTPTEAPAPPPPEGGIYVGASPIMALQAGGGAIQEVYVGAIKVWPVATAFDPRDLPNLEFFVDADLSTFAPGQWDDISGNARHAVQATPGFQPSKVTSGGLEVINFDGVDDHMIWTGTPITGITNYTLLVITRFDSFVGGTGAAWFSGNVTGQTAQDSGWRGRHQSPGGNFEWNIRARAGTANEFNAVARIDTGGTGSGIFAWSLWEFGGAGTSGTVTTHQGATATDTYSDNPLGIDNLCVACRHSGATGTVGDISARAMLFYTNTFTGTDRDNLIAWADDKITP